MIGVMKKSSCTRLNNSGLMSRYRVDRMPKHRATQMQFSTISASAGINARSVQCQCCGKDDRDDHEDDDVVREQDHLSPHQSVDVHDSGVGSCLIRPSLATNTSAPSRMDALIRFQMISPSVT